MKIKKTPRYHFLLQVSYTVNDVCFCDFHFNLMKNMHIIRISLN